ncbi:hypothetical protein BH10PSE1_BH10PSE1_19150 [soil metagenome]
MNAPRTGRPASGLTNARRWVVDVLLMRADARPEMAFAAIGAVVWLLLAIVLFGGFSGGGMQGPVEFERAEPARGADKLAPDAFLDASDQPSPIELQSLLSAMNTGRDFAAPDGLFEIGAVRTWLDENVCAASARRSHDERLALVYYIRNEADLCAGFGKAMILAPMAPTLTPIGSAILSFALLAVFAFGVWRGARFLRRVRRAYRRLYVSEHRADHLEADG